MEYGLAILVCVGLFILYAVLGAAVFGWKHGGGAPKPHAHPLRSHGLALACHYEETKTRRGGQ
jgi:hypothetical protein